MSVAQFAEHTKLLWQFSSPADLDGAGFRCAIELGQKAQGGEPVLQRAALSPCAIKISALVMGSSNREAQEFKQNSLSLASFTFELT